MTQLSPAEVAHMMALTLDGQYQRPEAEVARVPDPEWLAGVLPELLREALRSARCVMPDGIYRSTIDYAPDLREWGLCEVGGYFLTAYGMKVRRAILEETE